MPPCHDKHDATAGLQTGHDVGPVPLPSKVSLARTFSFSLRFDGIINDHKIGPSPGYCSTNTNSDILAPGTGVPRIDCASIRCDPISEVALFCVYQSFGAMAEILSKLRRMG